MCESMVGCQGVAFMTWLWIPVLEASRSSRLSVVGYKYTVYVTPSSHNGRCAKVCWHSWSWPISLCLIIANGFVANHVLFCGHGFGYSFCLAIAKALRMSVFVFSCFHASSDDDNRSPFQLSLIQLPPVRELRFDDLYARWGTPNHWTMSMVWLSYADTGQWKAWSMLWELIRTSSNSKLVSLSLGKDGATVTCSCIGRYYTIPYSSSAAKESARQSKTLQTLKWRCKKYSCIHSARGTRWCKQDIL